MFRCNLYPRLTRRQTQIFQKGLSEQKMFWYVLIRSDRGIGLPACFGLVEGKKIPLSEQNFVLIRPQRPKKSTFWVDFVDFWVGAPQKINFLSWFCWFLGLSRTQKSTFLSWFCWFFGLGPPKKSTFWVDFVDFWVGPPPKNQLIELILLIFGCPPKNQLFELILLIFGLEPPKKSTFRVDFVVFWACRDSKINFLSWFCWFLGWAPPKNQLFECWFLGWAPPKKSTFWVDFVDFWAFFCWFLGLSRPKINFLSWFCWFLVGAPKTSTFWVDFVDFWVWAPKKSTFSVDLVDFWAFFVDFWARRGQKLNFLSFSK